MGAVSDLQERDGEHTPPCDQGEQNQAISGNIVWSWKTGFSMRNNNEQQPTKKPEAYAMQAFIQTNAHQLSGLIDYQVIGKKRSV